MNFHHFTYAFVITCLMISPALGCGRGSIFIENNQYKNVLIAIADQVPEDENLIYAIMDVFTQASEYLYHATK